MVRRPNCHISMLFLKGPRAAVQVCQQRFPSFGSGCVARMSGGVAGGGRGAIEAAFPTSKNLEIASNSLLADNLATVELNLAIKSKYGVDAPNHPHTPVNSDVC